MPGARGHLSACAGWPAPEVSTSMCRVRAAYQAIGPGQHRMRVCLELPDGSQLRQRAVVGVLLLQPGRQAMAMVSECKRPVRARWGRAQQRVECKPGSGRARWDRAPGASSCPDRVRTIISYPAAAAARAGAPPARVLEALCLQLALRQARAHVVRVYQRPVQREAALRAAAPEHEQLDGVSVS